MTRTLFLALALGLIAGAAAAAPAQFPLHKGDRWTYEVRTPFGSTTEKTVAVDSTYYSWFHLTDLLGKPRWVRTAGDYIYVWDGKTELLYSFSSGLRTWSVDLGGCYRGSMGFAMIESVTTPAGIFADCYRIGIKGSCADAGVTTVWFAPGVGLVKWTEGNIAGETVGTLKTASVGGKTYPDPAAAAKGIVASLTLDGYHYWVNKMPSIGAEPRPARTIKVAFKLTNNSAETLKIDFRSSQTYDLRIVDAASGAMLWSWAANKKFMMALTSKTLAPGESWTVSEEAPLRTLEGADLLPAGYRLEFFTTGSPSHKLVAPFKVDWAY